MPGKRFSRLAVLSVLLLFSSAANPMFAQGKKAKGQLIQKDGVTAYIVRQDSSKSISLTMLIAHKTTFTQRVQDVLGRKVVPLVFSVSTLPHQAAWFEPSRLSFAQGGKTWQPDSTRLDDAVIFIGEDTRFGGMITSGEIHQAVILLPEWFDVTRPIYVTYHKPAQARIILTKK